MKIAIYYPEKGVYTDDKNWMYYLAESLEEKCEVYHNECPDDADFILGMTIGKIYEIRNAIATHPKIPFILYNWDMHPDLQSELGKWDEIGWDQLLEGAREVWTQTYYHAELAEKLSGVSHYVMPMGALDFEMEGVKTSNKGFVLMASRRDPYKGFEMFERACEEIKMPYISRHPKYGDRDSYIKDLSECKAVVIASEEEANTPMSGYEGAFLGKPLILRNIPAFREEWEECATYFQDIDGLKSALRNINPAMGKKSKRKAQEYTLEAFRDRIYNRLCEL